ncbi:alpha/beta hydrolase [Microvirga flavescens]|uniref:alpha/beta hydrolase n=1 Tax=Microvirga flavescens TaxID=2249811 RepID=UPI000DDABED3|nr:alpha/beta hydrolase-fold protein [Microvirga flavescens]
MRKDHSLPEGTVRSLWVDSQALRGNLLGDPSRRRVDVYIPAGHNGRGLPLLVDLVGYTAGGPAHTNWKNYGENVPERLDRLIGSGAMPPVVVAFPDCFTRLGGNQYIDSAAMGSWETFLVREMLPFIEGQIGCGGAGRRGVFGKSSGGYGAIVHALRHGGDVWSAAACHSGDMGFEFIYHLGEFAGLLRHLAEHDMSVEAFIRKFETGPKAKDADWHALMILAQCATFDPDPQQFYGIRTPVDSETCEFIPERWGNWLRWDPVRMADEPHHVDSLRKMKLIFIDCGTIDQYNLIHGARILHRKLEAAKVPHVYEEFHDNHSSVDYRMDRSLPLLARALS